MSEKRKDKKGRILKDGERQRNDGKYEFRYDYAGRRKSVYSWKLVPTDKTPPGKQEDLSLREKEKAIMKDIADGIDTQKATKMTFNELFRMYLGTKTKVKEKTVEHYKHLWELHVESNALGRMYLPGIKKVSIQHFYSVLHKSGISDATIRAYHNNLIKPALEFAVDNDLIRKNPAKGCLEGYTDARRRNALSIKEQQEFLEYVSGSTYAKYLPMFQVMIGTACRVGEICGLTWKDVDMKKRRIKIDHQLGYDKIDGKTRYFVSEPKTKSGIREIPMTEQVYKALMDQKKLDIALGRRGNFAIDGYDGFVFLNEGSRPFTTSLINAILRRIVEQHNKMAAGAGGESILLPHISNHILRHTGCTRMAEAGMDPKVLQVIMGHSDISVTMKVYNHVDKERMYKEIKKVKNVI